MDGSAQEAAQSATEKPNYKDDKDEDADTAKDGRRSKMAEVLRELEKHDFENNYFLWDADEPAQDE